jgi:hypothetical protein
VHVVTYCYIVHLLLKAGSLNVLRAASSIVSLQSVARKLCKHVDSGEKSRTIEVVNGRRLIRLHPRHGPSYKR